MARDAMTKQIFLAVFGKAKGAAAIAKIANSAAEQNGTKEMAKIAIEAMTDNDKVEADLLPKSEEEAAIKRSDARQKSEVKRLENSDEALVGFIFIFAMVGLIYFFFKMR